MATDSGGKRVAVLPALEYLANWLLLVGQAHASFFAMSEETLVGRLFFDTFPSFVFSALQVMLNSSQNRKEIIPKIGRSVYLPGCLNLGRTNIGSNKIWASTSRFLHLVWVT